MEGDWLGEDGFEDGERVGGDKLGDVGGIIGKEGVKHLSAATGE